MTIELEPSFWNSTGRRNDNVCTAEKHTKCTSILLLPLERFSAVQTLSHLEDMKRPLVTLLAQQSQLKQEQ